MEWINVKDKVPDNNERVIVCRGNDISNYGYPYTYEDACEMGWYENEKWYSDTLFDIIEDSGDLKIRKRLGYPVNGKCEFEVEAVTHWMPLPRKPEGIL